MRKEKKPRRCSWSALFPYPGWAQMAVSHNFPHKVNFNLKDTVDLPKPFFNFFSFNVELSIIILTIVSKKNFLKILIRTRVIYRNVFSN